MKRVIRAGTDYKRIDNANAFDNGHVIHNDWMKVSDEEAEEMARQKSLEDPRGVYYVKYDDIMNPSSNIKWVNGESYTDYKDALDASRPENFDELYRQNFEKSYR